MTSVNSIGPDGRGTVALGEGDGLALATSDEGVDALGASVFLHATENRKTKIQTIIELSFMIRKIRWVQRMSDMLQLVIYFQNAHRRGKTVGIPTRRVAVGTQRLLIRLPIAD